MADSPQQVVEIGPENQIADRLVLIFNDVLETFAGGRSPSPEDAALILNFVRSHPSAPMLVVQCQVGVGRSQAVAAALGDIFGNAEMSRRIRRNGTYNRKLFALLLKAAGLSPEAEPLVSMAVRVKYAPDRLQLFLLSMKRQRYQNWELVAVTDGPNPEAVQLVRDFGDKRIRIIETPTRLGRWGHPYRQLGINACEGEFMGLSNDDNYYVPGYLEQMVNALDGADIALCQTAHSYSGWSVAAVGADLGCWIARSTIVRSTPWTGADFDSDGVYLKALLAKAGSRVARIERPLFIHN